MAKITMKMLLESGVHFGHRTHRWNPNMRTYIFTERNGIHIIDLQQTVQAVKDVYKIVRDMIADGGVVLFVGTKRQAVDTIQVEAERCGMPYVVERWLGGMLTNWTTMRQRITELERLERMREAGDFERLTKKEGLMLTRKIDKLELRFGGIREMHKLPDMLFVVDVRREDTAIKEANMLDIPVVALVDTNCDPRDIEHVIPSNDDAIRAIKLLVSHMADAVIEGRAARDDEDDFQPPVPVEELVAEEEELADKELLGASTLEKMTAQAEVDAEAAEIAAAEAAAKAAAAAEESSETETPEAEAEDASDAEDEKTAEAEEDAPDAVEEESEDEEKTPEAVEEKSAEEEKTPEAVEEEPAEEEKAPEAVEEEPAEEEKAPEAEGEAVEEEQDNSADEDKE